MMNLEDDKIRCVALLRETDSDCSSSIDSDEKNAEYKTQTANLHLLAVK